MRLFHPSALAVLAITLAAGVAQGQQPPRQPAEARTEAERTEQARERFTQGVRFARAERWQEAADHFGQALELKQTPQIRYNLAESLYHLGRLVEASEHVAFLEAAEDVPRSVRRSLGSLRERIEGRIGRLTLQVRGAGPGDRVTLDGRLVSPDLHGASMPVNPGHHLVRVTRGDQELRAEEVHIPEGGAAELLLDVPPPTARQAALAAGPGDSAPGGDAIDEDSGGIGPWWLWTAIAVVVVGGAATAAVLLSGEGEPTQGDFMPGVLEVP